MYNLFDFGVYSISFYLFKDIVLFSIFKTGILIVIHGFDPGNYLR